MRLASFNVENLFASAKALNATAKGDVSPVLQAFDRFNTLVTKHEYKPEDEAALLEDLETLEVVVRTSGALRLNKNPLSAWALGGRPTTARKSSAVDSRVTRRSIHACV